MLKLSPIHGFSAKSSSANIIAASHFGMPVSTAHVASAAVLGVGATKSLLSARWGIAVKIVIAWVLMLLSASVWPGVSRLFSPHII